MTAPFLSSSSNRTSSLMEINDTKAGMKGLDKEKINQIIREASKDSPYYKHNLEREKRINEEVEKKVKTWKTFTEQQKQNALEVMQKGRVYYERQARDLSHIIVHIDMDMFFAAVEMRDNPDLRDKPMAVGGISMLSTSNYAARRYGVRAAMAGFIGKKLCPDLIIIKGDHRKYSRESEKIMSVLRKYDPDICVVGCDEAYLDLTAYVTQRYLETHKEVKEPILIEDEWSGEKKFKPEIWDLAYKIVEEIRAEVFQATQLTASAGITTNTMLAKICSDMNKPNGQFMLPGHSFEFIQEFVEKINVRKIPGIGPVQEKILKAFKIDTCKDLWDRRDLIHLLFKPASIDFYLRVSLGLGSTHLKVDDEPRKSKGKETTFKATNDFSWLDQELKALCEDVAQSLDKHGLKGKTLTLKLKKDSFEVTVRSKSLSCFTSDATLLHQTARSILKAEMSSHNCKYRLMGVRVSNLNETFEPKDENKQMTLDQFMRKSEVTKRGIEEPCTSMEIEHFDDPFDQEDSKEFICIFCSSSFPKNDLLKEHLSFCTKEEPQNCNDQNIERESCMNCPVCNRLDFTDLNTLNSHLDICLGTEAVNQENRSFFKRKRKGKETTFKATNDFSWLDQELKALCEDVAQSLDKHGLKGKTLTLKLKKDSFEVTVRSKSLSCFTSDATLLHQTARSILKAEMSSHNFKYLLMGVRVSNLNETFEPKDENKQMTLDQFITKREVKKHGIEESCTSMEIEHFDDPFDQEDSKEFICIFCSSSFPKNDLLKEHLSICTKEEPQNCNGQNIGRESCMSCPVCNRLDFTDLNTLNSHLDICLATDAMNRE